MLALVRAHAADQDLLERDAHDRRRRGVTFREVANGYLSWLDQVKGAKPSTLRDHRSVLGEPGRRHRRGEGESAGRVMAALGDRPAREITTREIEQLLVAIVATGVAPRTVNKARAVISSAFNYGMRPSAFGLADNPARHDSELIRVAAYAGLRRGELVALRWRDVDFLGHKLIVRRAVSGDVEVASTKSRRAREVPLPDQAAGALDRLSRRGEFVSRDDFVFCNRLGRRLDASALRRRFERARDAAGLEPLRFHDLRHTYGSLLVAGGIDLASVKAAMGHARISTTERYLHARPAGELADRFTLALAGAAPAPPIHAS